MVSGRDADRSSRRWRPRSPRIRATPRRSPCTPTRWSTAAILAARLIALGPRRDAGPGDRAKLDARIDHLEREILGEAYGATGIRLRAGFVEAAFDTTVPGADAAATLARASACSTRRSAGSCASSGSPLTMRSAPPSRRRSRARRALTCGDSPSPAPRISRRRRTHPRTSCGSRSRARRSRACALAPLAAAAAAEWAELDEPARARWHALRAFVDDLPREPQGRALPRPWPAVELAAVLDSLALALPGLPAWAALRTALGPGPRDGSPCP